MGQSLAEGGPMVIVGGPLTKTQKKGKKDSESLDVVYYIQKRKKT